MEFESERLDSEVGSVSEDPTHEEDDTDSELAVQEQRAFYAQLRLACRASNAVDLADLFRRRLCHEERPSVLERAIPKRFAGRRARRFPPLNNVEQGDPEAGSPGKNTWSVAGLIFFFCSSFILRVILLTNLRLSSSSSTPHQPPTSCLTQLPVWPSTSPTWSPSPATIEPLAPGQECRRQDIARTRWQGQQQRFRARYNDARSLEGCRLRVFRSGHHVGANSALRGVRET